MFEESLQHQREKADTSVQMDCRAGEGKAAEAQPPHCAPTPGGSSLGMFTNLW